MKRQQIRRIPVIPNDQRQIIASACELCCVNANASTPLLSVKFVPILTNCAIAPSGICYLTYVLRKQHYDLCGSDCLKFANPLNLFGHIYSICIIALPLKVIAVLAILRTIYFSSHHSQCHNTKGCDCPSKILR